MLNTFSLYVPRVSIICEKGIGKTYYKENNVLHSGKNVCKKVIT